jgi:hypothetical protein
VAGSYFTDLARQAHHLAGIDPTLGSTPPPAIRPKKETFRWVNWTVYSLTVLLLVRFYCLGNDS